MEEEGRKRAVNEAMICVYVMCKKHVVFSIKESVLNAVRLQETSAYTEYMSLVALFALHWLK